MRYLCVVNSKHVDQVRLLGAAKSLEISVWTAIRFLNNVDDLDKYDGLILSLHLEPYSGSTLARHVRILIEDGKIKDLPIVLFVDNNVLITSYNRNTLYDVSDIELQTIDLDNGVILKLNSLASGYRRLNSIADKNLQNFLNLDDSEYKLFLPYRFRHYFSKTSLFANNVYARFMIKQVLQRSSIIISENYLAALLGIDFHSSIDWARLKARLMQYSYTGIFHRAWPGWFEYGIEFWWREISGCKLSLSNYTAQERLDTIRFSTGLKNLSVAAPIKPSYSTKFDTLCQVTSMPLDSISDGIAVAEDEPLSWQKRRYMALFVALSGEGKQLGIYPNAVELDRLNLMLEDMV